MDHISLQPLSTPEVLQLQELPLTVLPRDQVRLQVKTQELNIPGTPDHEIETAQLSSLLSTHSIAIVSALGRGVQGFKIGDRVSLLPPFELRRNGRYAEYLQVKPDRVIRQPEAIMIV